MELIKRALVDEHAMAQLLSELEPFVYRVAYHLTLHQQDAEDISQEVLYRICNHLSRYRGESSLQTWIYKLVLNSHRDFLRKKRRTDAQLGHDVPVRSFEADVDTRIVLDKLFATLPEQDRQILILRFQNELSVHEVAHIMNLSESNVKTRVFRLKEKLRSLFLQGGNVL